MGKAFLRQLQLVSLPTSPHSLHQSSVVPLSSARFLETITSFKQHLKMNVIVPGSTKDNKASPCSTAKFKRPVSQDGLNTTRLYITSPPVPTPPRPTSIGQKGDS